MDAAWQEEWALAGGYDEGAMYALGGTGPPSPVMPYPLRRRASKFEQLMFLRRVVPYRTVIRSHLRVTQDLKQARAAAAGPGQD